jgi:hypothetical protein
MAAQAERLQVVKMMDATQRAVRAARLLDVIDFKPIGLAETLVLWVGTRRRLMPAPFATITIASLRGAPRKRPPVVGPEPLRAAIAAPHSSP